MGSAISRDPNEKVVVRFDGCCGWTILPHHTISNIRKECPHYSLRGITTQDWCDVEFKTSNPIEFVTTWKDLMQTADRYISTPSYHKNICTVMKCHHQGISDCSQGKGYY